MREITWRNCEWCMVEFMPTYPKRGGKRRQRFCSAECRIDANRAPVIEDQVQYSKKLEAQLKEMQS